MPKPFCVVTTKGDAVSMTTLESFALKEAGGDISRQIPQDNFAGAYGTEGVVAPPYAPEKLQALLELNTYHARACRVKARDAAGLGWAVNAVDDGGQDASKAAAVEFFKRQPMLLTETLFRYQYDQEAVGYSAMELVRRGYAVDGEPEFLGHIPAHTLRRHNDGIRILQRRGTRKRWFKIAGTAEDVHKDTGHIHGAGALPEEQRASEIIWGVSYAPRTELYGIPEFIPAIGTIDGDYSRREYNRTFFSNYGIPNYVVYISGNFDADEKDADGKSLIEQIKAKFAEVTSKPGSTMVLSIPSVGGDEVKVEFKALATEVKEASFRLFRKDNRDEILTAHGVDPYRVGVVETGSLGGTAAVEATKIYKDSTLEPRQRMIEDMLDLHILRNGFQADGWTFELAEIDTEDEKAELALHEALIERGAMTPAEMRRIWAERVGIDAEMPEAADDLRYAVVGLPALVQGGLITLNEGRKAVGLPAMPGGDVLYEPTDAAMGAVEKALKSAWGDA